MLYESTLLRQPLPIRRIYTIHFYEYDSDYAFEGESHDFWELVYVDRGTAEITRGGQTTTLDQGQAVLHAPGVFHTVRSQGKLGMNLFVLSFDSAAPELHLLAQAPFALMSADKQRLSAILSEARAAFLSPLDDAYFKLRRRESMPYAAEQLILLEVQALFIHLLRRFERKPELGEAGDPADQAGEDQLSQAILLMQQNLMEPLGIEEVCKRCLISRSKLQRLFRQRTGKSALNYYIHLRLEAAKGMMRSRQHTYSEIADTLGFGSIHYFSKLFKQVTGMTPTEYSASLRSLTDRRSC